MYLTEPDPDEVDPDPDSTVKKNRVRIRPSIIRPYNFSFNVKFNIQKSIFYRNFEAECLDRICSDHFL